MLQYVAICCSVMQFVAVCCSVLQCATVCCSVLRCVAGASEFTPTGCTCEWVVYVSALYA